MRLQINFLSERHDRVERPACGSRKMALGTLQCQRRVHGLRPAEEFSAVTFMFASHFAPRFDNHRMDQHDRFFIRRARTAREQQRVLVGKIFAFDKKFVERGMPPIGSLRRQHHFAITGQFQLAGLMTVVQDIHAPNLNPIRADGDSSPQGNSIDPNAGTQPCADKTSHQDVQAHIRWADGWQTKALRSRGLANRSTCPTGRGWYRHCQRVNANSRH